MPFTTLSLGLTLTIPTNGTKNWGTTLLNTTWTKISAHDHTGGGNGNKISAAAITANSIDHTAITKNLQRFVQSFSPTTGTQAIDWDNGEIIFVDLESATVDVGLTLSNPADGALYEIITKGGPGGYKVTYPSSVVWPSGVNPIHSTGDDELDRVFLRYIAAEGKYFGWWELDHGT